MHVCRSRSYGSALVLFSWRRHHFKWHLWGTIALLKYHLAQLRLLLLQLGEVVHACWRLLHISHHDLALHSILIDEVHRWQVLRAWGVHLDVLLGHRLSWLFRFLCTTWLRLFLPHSVRWVAYSIFRAQATNNKVVVKLLLLVLYTVAEVTFTGRRLIAFVLVLIRSLLLFLNVESTSLVFWLVFAVNCVLLRDNDSVL